jgi:hypothetical protein
VWFAVLAMPFLLLSLLLIGAGVAQLFDAGTISLPLAGTGVLLGALSLFLLMSGALGELVYTTGDVDMSRFAMTTIREQVKRPDQDNRQGQLP